MGLNRRPGLVTIRMLPSEHATRRGLPVALALALGGAGLLGLMACAADVDFSSPPEGPADHRLYAVREGTQSGWWLEARNVEAQPLLLPGGSSVYALDYSVELGLPRDRRLERGDLGTAGCEVMEPVRVRAAELEGGAHWLDAEPPEVLTRILRGLAQDGCHRCVRFAEKRLLAGSATSYVQALEVLASGAALAWVQPDGATRVSPEEGAAPLTGCGERPSDLVPSGRPNEFYAVRGRALLRFQIDEPELRCRVETATVVPNLRLARLAVSSPEEPFEAFLLTEGDRGLALHRYRDGLLELALVLPEWTTADLGLVRVGAGDALASQGFGRLFRWRNGTASEHPLPAAHEIWGLTRVPPAGPVLIMTQGLSAEAAAHEFRPETGSLHTLGRLWDRARSAAPFRDGFVIVNRSGAVLEYHLDRFCPESTSLGNRGNHAPNAVRAAPGAGLYLDPSETSLSLLHPLPPDPPSELEF